MAQKVTIDKITYKIEKGEAYVYEADENIEVANILSSVEYKGKSYPVTRISRSFKIKLTLNEEKLLSGYAFYNCKNLRSVTIPNSVTTIEWGAFGNCKSLLEISIPNSVKYIGENAFISTLLRRIIVPDYPIKVLELKIANRHDSPFNDCNYIAEIRCQNGSFPTYMLPYLPDNCPFMLAQKFQQVNGNNNMYAQNVQQPVVPNNPNTIEMKVPSSDVDVNLPTSNADNSKTFAIIIGNEKYTHVSEVQYAVNDAKIFAEYCQKTLGLPVLNVRIYDNATYGTMLSAIDDIKRIAEAYNGDIKVIFYYAGHGVPNEATKDAFLLPVDANGQHTDVCYPVSRLYKELGELGAKNVIVFMDACFSGAQRGEGMLASARGVALKAKASAPQGNMVVFSAATGDETAFPYKEKGHGMFTYFLLKKLRDTKGDCTLGELGEYIQTNVRQQSVVVNRKSQTPTVVSSTTIAGNWKGIKLK